MMKKIAAILLLALSTQSVLGFTSPHSPVRTAPQQLPETPFETAESRVVGSPGKHISSFAGFVTGAVGIIGQVVAADDIEMTELPSPFVPVIFGVVLLGGVGLLTASLGNVMDEEAGLGMQSGARAKKEIERSRSSYFGKRPK